MAPPLEAPPPASSFLAWTPTTPPPSPPSHPPSVDPRQTASLPPPSLSSSGLPLRSFDFASLSNLHPKICVTTSTSAGLDQILPWMFYQKDKRSMAPSESDVWTLETVRDSLIRQEDTIIFCLIERAKHPFNKNAYNQTTAAIPGRSGSLAEIMIQEAEALFAKFGRYENPEEHPFFPENLPGSGVPTINFPQIFHPAAASVNVNPRVWDAYFNQLLPLIAEPGDDGNYASTVSCDLACLQALSRRIHYGKYVAEVKFRDETEEYEPVIRAMDRDALMKLLTFKKVEEMVKRRVEKKAMIFGQEATLDDGSERRKIDPGVVSRLYDEWVMPLTKEVEVEYLLRRLD